MSHEIVPHHCRPTSNCDKKFTGASNIAASIDRLTVTRKRLKRQTRKRPRPALRGAGAGGLQVGSSLRPVTYRRGSARFLGPPENSTQPRVIHLKWRPERGGSCECHFGELRGVEEGGSARARACSEVTMDARYESQEWQTERTDGRTPRRADEGGGLEIERLPTRRR